MGYTVQKFFIIHSWDHQSAVQAQAIARDVFHRDLVGPVMSSIVNNEHGFIVWTSGSKQGWSDATEHDDRISTAVVRMSKLDHPPEWVTVATGEDLNDIAAERGQDENYTHEYTCMQIGNQ